MANRLGKLQKLVYVPAIPAIAGQAAYCVTRTQSQSFSGNGFGGGSAAAVQPSIYSSNDGYYDQLPDGYAGIGGGFNYSPYAPAQVTVKTCYPAIPGRAGTPARLDTLENFGWNAGARSSAKIPDNGYFSGVLPPSPVGVQFGLIGRSPIHDYSEMAHSLVVRYGALTVVERGKTVAGPFAVPSGATVKVQRLNGRVTYWANGTELYTSTEASAGDIYGGALLYSAIDYVNSPEVGAVTAPIAFSAALPSLLLAVSESALNQALLKLPGIRLAAQLDLVSGVDSFAAEFPGVVLAVSESAAVSMVSASLPALSLRAELVNAEAIPDNFIGVLAPTVLSANLLAGAAISFSADLRFCLAVSEQASFIKVDANLPTLVRMSAREPYLPENTMDGSEAAVVADFSVLESALLLIAMDGIDVGDTASLVLVLELTGMDGLSIGEHASFGSVVSLLAMEQVAVNSHAEAARQQALQYAVNYLTGALTTYQDFDFAGFTQNAGRAFAWNSSGLYQLGADRDDGEVINALVDFGATDYADAHQKRMDMAFIGVRTDGECYLRLYADDGVERLYQLVGGGNQKRAALAKGVSSRYWNVRLELVDASFATIDNVELQVGVTQRRSFSRRG